MKCMQVIKANKVETEIQKNLSFEYSEYLVVNMLHYTYKLSTVLPGKPFEEWQGFSLKPPTFETVGCQGGYRWVHDLPEVNFRPRIEIIPTIYS